MVRTKRLRWSMFWAVISYIVTTLGAALTTYLTALKVTPLQGSLISTGVGLGVVMIGVLIDHAKDSGGEPVARTPVQQPVRRTSWAAAILVVLLLCGGGGLAITYAGHWVGQKAASSLEEVAKPPWEKKIDEPGVARLARPVSETSGILAVTVNSVEVNSQATIINLTGHNTGNEAIALRGAQLSVPGSNTLRDDPPTSDFTRSEVPAAGEYTGRIVFDGVIGPQVTGVTLRFTRIFSLDFNAPRNLSIEIPLNTVQTQ